ncbi:MAG: acetyl-CoA carboxylase biotin carboxyl carrier protein [Rhodospirillales bacterium]
MPLSYQNVADILKLIDSSNLNTLEIDIDGMRLVVRKGPSAGPSAGPSTGPGTDETSAAKPAPELIQAPAVVQATEDDDDDDGEHVSVGAVTERTDGAIEIRAPMMGTFYRAPSPTDPAYAEVGQAIQAGEALCIIEVMKLFTTLKAEQAGTVREIPAENGALVNQGDVLFVIQPA